MTDHPKNEELSSWQWDYPVGAGEYAALYPKSWFDYKWDKFPAHVVLEQFSPVLPDNYRESSYPVAVYRWHAENPTNQAITVSVLLSWTNMDGWFRTYTHDFQGALNQGNHNDFRNENRGDAATMKGIVFDRNRAENEAERMGRPIRDRGARIARRGSLLIRHEFLADGDGKAVWTPFPKMAGLRTETSPGSAPVKNWAAPSRSASRCSPARRKSFRWSIAWDFPVVEFGQGRKWNRRYTDFYGTKRQQFMGHRSRRLAPRLRMERRHRCLAGSLHQ